jgi:hypothetical protein
MFLYITFISLLFPNVANAYLDPGTGSYIVQVLIAVFATGGYLLKLYWGRIKKFVSKNNEDKDRK